MTSAAADKALLAAPPLKKAPDAPKLVRVAREHAVGPLTQFRQILGLQIKKTGLHPSEYYDFELYAPRYSAEEREQFVGVKGSQKLNARLSPEAMRLHDDFMNDKAMFSNFLSGLGMAATETQAMVDDRRLFGNVPVLRDLDAIRTFLALDARYPIFAKPAVGSRSLGSALIERVEPDGTTLRFGNGETMALEDFAQEILNDYAGRGFLFQSAVRQHSKLTEVVGPALGTIRAVTVTEEADRPRILYTLWKIPSPRAMSDNFWQNGSMLAPIDIDTGEVLRVRQGTGLDTEYISNHPVTGQTIVGTHIPYWSELKALAVQAHALFPNSGVLGWDIGMSDEGPVIVECNNSPFHTLYQLATGEGVLNRRFAAVFDKIAKRQASRLKLAKKAQKAKGHRRGG